MKVSFESLWSLAVESDDHHSLEAQAGGDGLGIKALIFATRFRPVACANTAFQLFVLIVWAGFWKRVILGSSSTSQGLHQTSSTNSSMDILGSSALFTRRFLNLRRALLYLALFMYPSLSFAYNSKFKDFVQPETFQAMPSKCLNV